MSVRNRRLPSGAEKFEASVSHRGARKRALFDTKTDARAWELEERNKARAGTFLADGSKVSVGDLTSGYFEHLALQLKSDLISEAFYYLKIAQVQNYIIGNRPFKRNSKYDVIFKNGIGRVKLRDITEDVVTTFVDHLRASGLSTKGTKAVKMTLGDLLEYARRKRYLALNPARGLAVKKTRTEAAKPEIDLAPELIAAMMSYAPPSLLLLVKVAVLVGLRRNELRALRWSDLDTETGQLSITKALDRRGKEAPTKTVAGIRKIPISSRLLAELEEHRRSSQFSSHSDYIFTSKTGKPYGRGTLWNQWHKAYELAIEHWPVGKPIPPCPRWHDLRHLCASFWADSGMRPKLAQKYLGHKSHDTTLRIYTHVLAKKTDNGEMDRIGEKVWSEAFGRNDATRQP